MKELELVVVSPFEFPEKVNPEDKEEFIRIYTDEYKKEFKSQYEYNLSEMNYSNDEKAYEQAMLDASDFALCVAKKIVSSCRSVYFVGNPEEIIAFLKKEHSI